MTTAATPLLGASSASNDWEAIDWPILERDVRRLQMRIAKAAREKRWGKVKALQWLLTHSRAAKLSAVRRVVRNPGRHTAGVDGVVWRTSNQKLQAARSLKRRGYQAKPLRRVYIAKRNGKPRPLGIPVMEDRAQQALHLLALEPVSETLADPNAYGFRPKRSAADAIGQCFNVLARRNAASWILEGDIKSCFDRISHSWLVDHVPMDKDVLRKWLAAGYMEEGIVYPTEAGTPQGGIASPVLSNMALDGLEAVVKQAAPPRQKVHVVKYADDFIVTGASKEMLEEKIKPAIVTFLRARGLELSPEKTRITHIDDGFDFLGFNIRKYQGTLLIKPSKNSVKRFLSDVRGFIKANKGTKTDVLIQQLNQKLRGWTNYYRHVVAKDTFEYIDHRIFWSLWSWIKRRHPNKSTHWRRQRYFQSVRGNHWVFFATFRDSSGVKRTVELFKAARVAIIRHIKIRADATPYDPSFTDYFRRRAQSRRTGRQCWAGMEASTA